MFIDILLAGVSDCRSCTLFDIRIKINIYTKTANDYINLDSVYLNNEIFIIIIIIIIIINSILADEINLDGKTLVDSDNDVVNKDSHTNSDLINDINSDINNDTDSDINSVIDSDIVSDIVSDINRDLYNGEYSDIDYDSIINNDYDAGLK